MNVHPFWTLLFSVIDAWVFIALLMCVCVILTTFGLAGLYCSKRYKGRTGRTVLAFCACGFLSTLTLMGTYGMDKVTFQLLLLTLILLVASYADLKTRMVEDYFHVMILLIAFIGQEIVDVAKNIPGAIAVLLFVTIVSVVASGSSGRAIGGADIKISAAITLAIGFQRGIYGMILGMILGVVCTVIKQMCRKHRRSDKEIDAGFALVPYLSIGFFVLYALV